MRSNLLLNNIQSIQLEYKELLTTLVPKLRSCYAPEALDEINLFWFRHIEEVQLYLKEWFPGENSYVFTASTFMDYEDQEHLPFLLMGDRHVLDDPLCRYSEIRSKMSEGKDAELLSEQIAITAADNLKLLENNCCGILILPLRLLSLSKAHDSLYKEGERAFISLFDGITDLNDFFSKCNSICDVIKYGRDNIEKLVLFSEEDNISLPFDERFNAELERSQYLIDTNQMDSYKFYVIVYGYIQQAIDVIVSCVEYGCFPYIRYPISLHYISILADSLLGIDHIDKLRFKMSVAFIVYQICDKDRLSSVSLEDYIKVNQKYNFSSRLFCALAEQGIDENSFLDRPIYKIVADELEKFYSALLAIENSD